MNSAEQLQTMSSFDEWTPRDYLAEYFSELQEDERVVVRYFVERMRGMERGPVLVFGCGPGLNHVFLTAPHASQLVLSDYLPANLTEIEKWRQASPSAHDWTPFVRYTLLCESHRTPTDAQVRARIAATRQAHTTLARGDASLADPLGPHHRGQFAAVISAFCADSITSEKQTWERYCKNIASLVRPGGLFLTAALRRARWYRVGSRRFPAAGIDTRDLRMRLGADFATSSVDVRAVQVPEQREQGYSGILLGCAKQRLTIQPPRRPRPYRHWPKLARHV